MELAESKVQKTRPARKYSKTVTIKQLGWWNSADTARTIVSMVSLQSSMTTQIRLSNPRPAVTMHQRIRQPFAQILGQLTFSLAARVIDKNHGISGRGR